MCAPHVYTTTSVPRLPRDGDHGVPRMTDFILGNINLNTEFRRGPEGPIQRRTSNDHT